MFHAKGLQPPSNGHSDCVMLSLTTPTAFAPPPAAFNMAAYVLQHAGQTPEKTALEVVGNSVSDHWTYHALEAAVRGVGTGLLQSGCKAGDRVMLRLGNTADFPIAYLGCIAVGLIPVPVSMQLTAPELRHIASYIQPRLVVQSDPLDLHGSPTIAPDTLREFHTLSPAEYVVGDPNRPAYIIHTSGTSGRPQAVVHAHRAVWARRMMWDDWYGLRQTDRMLHAGAFNWTYTLGTGLMDPWAIGATAIIPQDGTAPSALPALMAEHRATIFAAAPGVYRRLLRADMPPLPNLRHGLCAGEKLPDETRRQWTTATNTAIHEAFGMSECSTFISGSPTRPAPDGTSGFAQSGRRLAILDNGVPTDIGTTGTIAVHTSDSGLMLGYLDPATNAITPPTGDWFETGDIGSMAADGAITYQGRRDDMMNAGGIRVSPIEVETALGTHPDISEAAACAVQVKKDVTVIAAFYTSDVVLDHDQLTAWCADQLAAYKMPRLFIACETLPRGANNKLLRRVLRQNWETENGQT